MFDSVLNTLLMLASHDRGLPFWITDSSASKICFAYQRREYKIPFLFNTATFVIFFSLVQRKFLKRFHSKVIYLRSSTRTCHQMCSVKKLFLKILKYSQENTCECRVYLKKLQALTFRVSIFCCLSAGRMSLCDFLVSEIWRNSHKWLYRYL